MPSEHDSAVPTSLLSGLSLPPAEVSRVVSSPSGGSDDPSRTMRRPSARLGARSGYVMVFWHAGPPETIRTALAELLCLLGDGCYA